MELQWPLILFTALTGTAGWMLACLTFDEFKGITKSDGSKFAIGLAALIVLIVGGLASVVHLSHPERMMGALGHPTSGIFTEAVLVGLSALFAIAYLIVVKRSPQAAGARKVMVVLAAVFGVLLSFMAGSSYMMASRPAWDTVLLPLGYLGTAIPTGIAAYMVAGAALKEDVSAFAKWLLVGGVVGAVLAAAFGLQAGAASQAVAPFAIAVLGSVVAAAVGALLARGGSVQTSAQDEAAVQSSGMSMLAVALVCTFVGAICYRCLMWLIGTGINNFFGTM